MALSIREAMSMLDSLDPARDPRAVVELLGGVNQVISLSFQGVEELSSLQKRELVGVAARLHNFCIREEGMDLETEYKCRMTAFRALLMVYKGLEDIKKYSDYTITLQIASFAMRCASKAKDIASAEDLVKRCINLSCQLKESVETLLQRFQEEDMELLLTSHVIILKYLFKTNNFEDIETISENGILVFKSWTDIAYKWSQHLFNLGIQLHKSKQYDKAVFLLRWSANAAENMSKRKEKSLRALALCLKELNQTQEALEITKEAFSVEESIESLVLLVQLNCETGNYTETVGLAMQAIRHQNCSIQIALYLCQIVLEMPSTTSAEKEQVFFCTSEYFPDNLVLKAMHASALTNQPLRQTEIMEQIVEHSKDSMDVTHVVQILWVSIKRGIDKEDYKSPIPVLNSLLKLFQNINDINNLTKCFQVLIFCHLQLGNTKDALELVKRAKSVATSFDLLVLELRCLLKSKAAFSAVKNCLTQTLITLPEDGMDALLVACEDAKDNKYESIALEMLQKVFKRGKDINVRFLAVREICGLENDVSVFKVLLEKSLSLLKSQRDGVKLSLIASLRNFTWNQALSFGKEKKFEFCQYFAALCLQFMEYAPMEDQEFSILQLKALQVSSSVEHIWTLCDDHTITFDSIREEGKRIGDSAVVILNEITRLIAKLETEEEYSGLSNTMVSFLMAIKYQVALFRDDKKTVDSIIEQDLPSASIKSEQLLQMAVIASKYPFQNSTSCKSMLDYFLSLQSHPVTATWKEIAFAFRQRILLSNSDDETETIYSNLDSIVSSNKLNDFPPDEAHWLVSRAWNIGAEAHRQDDLEKALKWSDIALKLLHHLNLVSLKSLETNLRKQQNTLLTVK